MSKLNKILQIIRDSLIMLLSSAIIISLPLFRSFFDNTIEVEISNYVVAGILAFIILLSIINLILIIAKVKNRVYYYFYTIFLFLPSSILVGLAWFLVLPFVILNILILITLRKKSFYKK